MITIRSGWFGNMLFSWFIYFHYLFFNDMNCDKIVRTFVRSGMYPEKTETFDSSFDCNYRTFYLYYFLIFLYFELLLYTCYGISRLIYSTGARFLFSLSWRVFHCFFFYTPTKKVSTWCRFHYSGVLKANLLTPFNLFKSFIFKFTKVYRRMH